jgi:hypothetical protein
MSRYVQFQLNGGVVAGRRLLRKDLMEEYHSIQFPHRDQRTGYTFGFWREVLGSTVNLYFECGGRGFGSHMIFYPEVGIGVVTLTNMEYHGLTGYPGRAIMNGPMRDRFGENSIADARLDEMQRIEPDDPRLKPILGRYGDTVPAVVGFEDGVLGIRLNDDLFLPMSFYDEGEHLVGRYGTVTEAHFLPPMGDQPGAMMTARRDFSNHNSHHLDFNDSPSDLFGPNKPEWQQYVGEYGVIWEDEPFSSAIIEIRNGYLYYRDGKCRELEPGLFVLYDGEILDFRTQPPTWATQEIRRKQD